MNDYSLTTITAVIVLIACIGFTVAPASEIPPANLDAWGTSVKPTMSAFRSDSELRSYLRAISDREKSLNRRSVVTGFLNEQSMAQPSAPPSAKSALPPTKSIEMSVDAPGQGKGAAESVTNTQHSGVDEGGIVKVHGDHLVVLRRGRLFTVAIGDDNLRPISVADAFGPDIDPTETWYDEMLVSENTIAVIGYSYDRGGTEIGLFKINEKGFLTYQFTHHLRSNDYYSSRNYASRLIGDKLIFYTPSYLSLNEGDPLQDLPAVRRWHRGAKNNEFKRIIPATRVYRPEYVMNSQYGLALHTVTVCDLANGGFDCKATGVVGPAGRVFYVSPHSVYVWMSEWIREDDETHRQALLYRMPLDGSAPSAVQVSGSPVDQFSFLETEDEQLNVLVRSEGTGDEMWSAESTSGDIDLLRLPLSNFSDGSETVHSEKYLQLPDTTGYAFQNRFIGDYLLYGSGSGWGAPQNVKDISLYAVQWKTGETQMLKIRHGVDRLEALGSDAVVVGTDGTDLHFTAIELGAKPKVAGGYARKGASQGELRSHGFFYKPDNDNSGTIGLPISLPGRPGYQHLFENSAAILFLRNSSLKFERLGELAALPERAVDDRCRASCVDWYGNARPLFLRGRVFALLGYEIVEGTLLNGYMRERRRVNYAPPSGRHSSD
ncbi:MAG TPA: beta-propeller domain-containing protein [Pyrinomonadaceae bacterium]|nr:beta-propeller domain-containing protein [Pyrinomonadaceae bacterium]